MADNAHLTITQRDLGILAMTWSYGGITVDHIRRRYFPTPGGRSPAFRRIAYLVEHEYLASKRLPSQTGQGSGKAFLTVGIAGRPLLAEVLGLSRQELGRGTRAMASLVILHHLAICDVRLSMELACEESPVFSLVDWSGDGAIILRAKDPLTRQDMPLIPDSTFTLALPDGTEQTFYLEMDMATVSPKRMKAKLRGYLGLHQAGDTTPVLWAVPDQARAEAISKWAIEEATGLRADPTIFWLALKDQLTEDTVLEKAVWQIIGGPRVALTELAGGSQEQRQVFPAEVSDPGYRQSLQRGGILQ